MSDSGGEQPTAGVARPARAISRRIGLPSGRAVLGAFLVTVAVVGLFASFRRAQEDTRSSYVVVASTVPAGQQISPADLAVRLLELGELADRTLTDPDDAVGSVAVQTLVPGQLLQEADIVRPGAGAPGTGDHAYEISFSLDRSRALGGRLVPGEVVDVIATLDAGGTSCTTVVAPKARVIRIGTGDDDTLTTRDSLAVTLAVDDDTAVLGLVFAVDESDVTIVRSTRNQDRALQGAYCGRSVVQAQAGETSS